jgi:hypothetical protein
LAGLRPLISDGSPPAAMMRCRRATRSRISRNGSTDFGGGESDKASAQRASLPVEKSQEIVILKTRSENSGW